MAATEYNDGNDGKVTVETFAAAGEGVVQDWGGYAHRTAQRISGTGTYTVEGSNDGTTWGALPTAVSAIATGAITILAGNPRFLRITVASAAATVAIYGFKS